MFFAVEQCEVPERRRERERVLHAVIVVARCREQRLGEPHDLRRRTLAPLSAREVLGGSIEVRRVDTSGCEHGLAVVLDDPGAGRRRGRLFR